MQSSHILTCMRIRGEESGDLLQYRDLAYFSDGFNAGLRITFALYHAFRLVRHPNYKASTVNPYNLPANFVPIDSSLHYIETENTDFNDMQTGIVAQTGYIGTIDHRSSDPDQVVHAHDIGMDYGTAFMTECLAQRLLDFKFAYYHRDIEEVLNM